MAGLFYAANTGLERLLGLLSPTGAAPIAPTAPVQGMATGEQGQPAPYTPPPAAPTAPPSRWAGLLSRLDSPQAQIGMRMLANSGYSNQRHGLGEIFGNSVMGYQGQVSADDLQKLQKELLKAQAEKLRTPEAKYASSPEGIYNVHTGAISSPSMLKPPTTDDIKEWQLAKETDGYKGSLQQWILEQKRAGALSVNMPTVPSPLITKWSDKLDKLSTDAQDAQTQLQVMDNGKKLLDKGIISGFAAEPRLALARALNTVGADNASTIANTEAYISNMGTQVGSIIKQFGSGTGLSNADREYAEKIVGGKITLNEQSMRQIIDINERMAKAKIRLYNKALEKGAGAFPDIKKLYEPVQLNENTTDVRGAADRILGGG
jgi:hypothetical protein